MTTTNGPQDEEPAASSADSQDRAEERAEQDAARRAEVAAHPYVAVTTRSTGIHPSTGRLVAVDAITFNDAGVVGEKFHAVINPGSDPGPHHYHGLTHEEVARGQRFSQVLRTLDRLIDSRTLVVHNAPEAWGYLVSEARRTMNAAARANRSRGRGRGRGRRRRQRVGHVPRPIAVVDTLASARRQTISFEDTRLGALAAVLGINAPSPKATVERAQRPEADTTRELTLLLIDVFHNLKARGILASREPSELRADRFGLQRSHVRVDAVEAPRPRENPGPYIPGRSLIRGMEVVVAPETEIDPNILIEACMRAELVYSEKLSRTTSLVVCNKTTNLRGKAMHAVRKNIPLMSDTAFLAAVERVKDARPTDR